MRHILYPTLLKKNVCNVLLTVIFNQRIIKAIHMLLIHGLCT